MEEVIFSGTEDKKPLNYAEVSLNISNEDKKLDLDYEDIKITRRIYRDNQSQFLINSKECRLKDIRELLLDTGIGKDGYSIISQGRVSSVINSNSKDRRALFEEASGISKHKYRKTESEKNLKKVEENLKEIESDFTYKKKELDILKKQKDNFEKYENLVEDINESSILYYKKTSDLIIKEKNKSLLERESIDKENQINEKDIENLESSINPIKIKIDDLSKNIDNLLKDKESISSKLNQLDKNIEINNQKLEFNQKDFDRVKNDYEKFNDKKEILINQVDELSEKKYKLEEKTHEIKVYIEKLRNDRKIIEENIEANNLSLENLDNKLKEIQSLLYKLDIKENTNENLRKKELEQKEALKKKLKENLELKDELLEKNNSFCDKNKKIKEEINELLKDIDLNKNKEQESNQLLDDINSNINRLNINIKEEISAYKVLDRMYGTNQGFFNQVQEFLNSTKNTKLKDHYIAPLSDLINIEDGYEDVINIALGSSIQNIVTKSQNDTKQLIDYVNNNDIGRITFLPLDRIKGYKKQRPNQREVIAMCYEIVNYNESLDGIIAHFLGNTIIVKDIKDAISLSQKINGYKIITLNLDVINPWGSMIAGKVKNLKYNSNLLNRKKKLRENKLTIINLDSKLKDSKKKRQTILNDRKNIDDIKISLKENLSKKKEELEVIEKLKSKNEFEIESINSRIEDIKIDLQKNEEYEDDNSNKEQLLSDRKNLEDKISKIKSKADEDNNNLSKLKEKLLDAINKSDVNGRDLSIIDSDISEKKNEIENNLEDIRLSNKIYLQTKEKISNLEKSIKDSKEKFRNLDKNLENISINIENLRKELSNLKEKISNDTKKLDINYKKRNKIELSFEKINLRIDNLNTKYEDLVVEINSMLIDKSLDDFKDSLDNYKSNPSISKKQIQLKLKSLNEIGFFEKDSKEKYDIKLEEFNFIETQKEDLLKSKEDIERLIRSLDKKMRKEFKEKFDIINENFKKIFKLLFLGGEASLELEDENLLEAGIEIKAKPPGKNLKNINLLSGGEKSLTAVCLLFAIFETNPAPFCLLDEIDAALDETNIKRYIDYLKTLSKNTQFIMITHRQTTMQLAEVIYGITMQEKGISKLYSIDFNDKE